MALIRRGWDSSESGGEIRRGEYPVEAIREAIANAVCHRDYSISNDIQIKVFEDRVVITNPGQLPFDMILEDLDNPDYSSRPRNKLIAHAFYDMHIIEHYGSGIRRMRKECDRNGSPYPTWTNGKGEFSIRFSARTPVSAAKLGVDLAKFGFDDSSGILKDPESTLKSALKSTLNPTDAKIVELIRGDGSVTIPVLEGKLGLSREGVRKALKRLKESNVIRRVGPDKGGALGARVVKA